MSKTTGTEKCLQEIVASLDDLIELASRPEEMSLLSDSISGWSVGKHVEHLALSDELTLDGLSKLLANPASGTPGQPTLVGRICLWAGFIPRGRGKAPKGVVPQGISSEVLADRLAAVRQGIIGLEASIDSLANSTATQAHPVFGRLDASQWLRFTEIHQQHHQKIMRDITRAQSS
jgi:hypothetical protein